MTLAFSPNIDDKRNLKISVQSLLGFLSLKFSNHFGTNKKKQSRSVHVYSIVIHCCSCLSPQKAYQTWSLIFSLTSDHVLLLPVKLNLGFCFKVVCCICCNKCIGQTATILD